jgi:hypothetical protein
VGVGHWSASNIYMGSALETEHRREGGGGGGDQLGKCLGSVMGIGVPRDC